MDPYTLIGNCYASTLINATGHPPVFIRLLNQESNHFPIVALTSTSEPRTRQQAVLNTNILAIVVTLSNGDAFHLIDGYPRFTQYGHTYRPAALFRIMEPLQNTARIGLFSEHFIPDHKMQCGNFP